MKDFFEFDLEVGDFSGDGHEKTKDLAIQCSHSQDELKSTYARAVKRTGLDPSNELAREYKDITLPREYFDKLVDVGVAITPKDFDRDSVDPKTCNFYLQPETFALLYMKFIQSEDNNVMYERVHYDRNPSIHIGGYGLF